MFATLGLNSFDSIVAFFGGNEVARKTTVLVKPAMLDLPDQPPVEVFYKQYEHHPPSMKFIGRPSKARCEFRNYDVFNRLGLACAEKIACGEQRDWLGRLRRAFIITRAIPESSTLLDFLPGHFPDRSTMASRTVRDALCRQLAGMLRRIHLDGFFHNDIYWRNILVTWQPPAEPRLWWIDCPRGQSDRWSPLRHRRRLKDLASLDKSAARFCTRGERVAFIKEYLGKARLDAEARKLIREALAYRRQRWPEDWNET